MSSGSPVDCPLPKRSSVHERLGGELSLEGYSRPRKPQAGPALRNRAALTWSGVAATTGMLAAVLAAPAVSATEGSSTDGERVAGRFGVEESWASVKSNVEEGSSVELRRDPAAASRARYRVPLEVRPCVAEVDVAANGSRQMSAQQMVYMPLREGTFAGTSYFGYRIHPIYGYSKLHEGDDYTAASGTPIYSVADGVVTKAEWDSGSGYHVVIRHTMSDGSVYDSWYMHQYESGVVVSVGQEVSAGQQIGAVGSSGLSTGPHLHLEIRDASGNALAPSQWLQQYGAVYLGEDC